ncbi:MAG TPA: fibronectin type III domain-containing protein, partial [Tepidisphaeraceae bacterium]|nr:fibronectin type III domain-containing protein [Tepidisphaeraceae bacterium]
MSRFFEPLEDRQLLSAVHYAPLAPSGLSASTASSTAISLHWKDNSNRESGYKIERSTDGKNFSQINTVGANTTSYTSGHLNKGEM